ncbi:P-loop containing nucleoside triphosphate hydrolase protein [Kalaharituber pfeilii]|nr:P-loop containing nucleoside triphosphate hydrolase protein [Kalaharituber pfeilii]
MKFTAYAAQLAASLQDAVNPIVIGVMGMTGTGKSTFIKLLTNDPKIIVGEDLESCTQQVQLSRVQFQTDGRSYDVYFADTPGFDDTNLSDTDVLENIAVWLGKQYEMRVKLSGIIYLHRITDDRVGGSAARNLTMLHQLVGDDNMRNVVMVTTRWEEMNTPALFKKAETREAHLLKPGGKWYGMVANRATHERHDGTYTSAGKIVGRIVKQSPVFIQIQKEIASGKGLADTAAGHAVKTKLEQDAEKHKKDLNRLEGEIQQAQESAKRNADLLQQQTQKYTELQKDAQKNARELTRIEDEMKRAKETSKRNADLLEQQRQDHMDLLSRTKHEEEEKRKLLQADNRRLQEKVDDLERGC